jgi:transcriptional regulator with XRE-family HTH domain
MSFHAIGAEIRRARTAKGLTQEALARAAGLSRTTVNRIENGVVSDIGTRKLLAVLAHVDRDLAVVAGRRRAGVDFIRMAAVCASVSFREPLAPDELRHALLRGRAPRARRPHLRALLDEAPVPLLRGLVADLHRRDKPSLLAHNLDRLARDLRCLRRPDSWLPAD